jgi:hypothetical protein
MGLCRHSPCLDAEVPRPGTWQVRVTPACAKLLRREQGTQAWTVAVADKILLKLELNFNRINPVVRGKGSKKKHPS